MVRVVSLRNRDASARFGAGEILAARVMHTEILVAVSTAHGVANRLRALHSRLARHNGHSAGASFFVKWKSYEWRRVPAFEMRRSRRIREAAKPIRAPERWAVMLT